MIDLVRYLVEQLAENKEEIEIVEEGAVIKVMLAKDDMGKVIGRQGKIIKAIRTLVRSACAKESVKYTVEVVKKG